VGSTTSQVLEVRQAVVPPVIVRVSGDCAVPVGGTLSLDVVATGDPAPTLQVRRVHRHLRGFVSAAGLSARGRMRPRVVACHGV
jgi:hypothetical protein